VPTDPSIPRWFRDAIAAPAMDRNVEVAGTNIHYLDWGASGQPGLILVHGGAAHAYWWSFVAPFFSRNWHVVAIDLSGHGDSGRRSTYHKELWADEVLAVGVDAGFPGPPVVVGHSLGGMVTITAAASHGDEMAGAVIVDAPVRNPAPESEEGSTGPTFRRPGVYASLPEAMGHFRLVPDQPTTHPYILEHIALHSLHETDAGWTWKFDPRVFDRSPVALGEQLEAVSSRVALIRGENSVIVPEDTAEYMYELLGRLSPVASIPESYHHLMVDQPLAFVASLRTLLADWNHSTPFRSAS
jgi:pimeloyl-ACP methyl ester carboxylesterase